MFFEVSYQEYSFGSSLQRQGPELLIKLVATEDGGSKVTKQAAKLYTDKKSCKIL